MDTVDSTNTVRVSVRYFAAAADAAGRAEQVVSLPAGATLAELRVALLAAHGPAMRKVLDVAAYLLGDELTRDLTTPIGPCVDVLPPFAGG